eukprot:403367990
MGISVGKGKRGVTQVSSQNQVNNSESQIPKKKFSIFGKKPIQQQKDFNNQGKKEPFDNAADSDDDFYEPTEKPDINRHDQNQLYITTKNSPQDSIQYEVTNKNFNPQSIEDVQHNYSFIKDNQGLSTVNKPIVQNQEEEIMSYLKINSKQYLNVIGVNYAGVEEVVIKKSVIDTNTAKSEMMKQMVFTGMMSETQQLKLLQSDKYIAQVKEEIIEYDHSSNLINDYLVIVERARFSLNDLLKIWNDEDLRSRYYEFYSPEKLAYYFYQAMQIMAYLHQRNVYYGDMKPHNLLVFKDQLVKVGDLGITMRLDTSIPDDQKAYYFKGMSLQHASQKTINDFHKTVPQSKKELLKCDIYSIISTFQKCIEYTHKLDEKFENKNMCQEIVNDLMSSQDLIDTLKKWSKNIMQNQSFVKNLITQMKDENKVEAVYHIFYLTKYKLILEGQLLPIIQDCENEKNMQKLFIQIDRLDKMKNYFDICDFINFDNSLPLQQTEALMMDLDFKQLVIDILSALKNVQYTNDQLKGLDKSFDKRKKFLFPLKFARSRSNVGTDQKDPDFLTLYEFSDLENIDQKNSLLRKKCNKAVYHMSLSFGSPEFFFQYMFNIDIEKLSQQKDFFANNYVNQAFLYIGLLKWWDKLDRALEESQIWLQKYRDLCGDSYITTLQLFGLVGELMIGVDQKKGLQLNHEGLNFLIKYSKLNLNAQTDFLFLLQHYKLHHIIPDHFPPFYHLLPFDKQLYSSLLYSVFLGIFEESIVIQTIEYIQTEIDLKDPEIRNNTMHIHNWDFLNSIIGDHDQFKIFMRYFESINITSSTIAFHNQTFDFEKEYEDNAWNMRYFLSRTKSLFNKVQEFKENKNQQSQINNIALQTEQ